MTSENEKRKEDSRTVADFFVKPRHEKTYTGMNLSARSYALKRFPRSGIIHSKNTVFVNRHEWEQLLAAVNDLVDIHIRLLKRMKEFKIRRGAIDKQLHLRTRTRGLQEPPRAIAETEPTLIVVEEKKDRPEVFLFCLHCGREIRKEDRYCDNCGRQLSS